MEEQAKEQKIPIGFTARTDQNIILTAQQFFDLMKALDVLSNITAFVKQQNIDKDVIRYYFEEDIVDATDEEGKPILGQDEKPLKTLRKDFWG